MLGRQASPGVERMGNRMERQEKKNSGDGKPAKAKFDWKLLPDVLALIRPRRGILAVGFGLMVINRVSGLVLPASTKYFLDDVILKRQARLLPVIVLVVVSATVIQGLTSYALTQLLSKSSWRMISELREKVQAHIGRLPVSFYDANKTGVLISRIMSDVEGVRNLIGTGLVEFAGGILTALFAMVYLLRTSVSMTALAFVILFIFGVTLNRAFKTIRPIFRARPKINAEVTGRLTESIGGVRVVKGYHAEAREEKVFGAGVQRLLDNVLQTLTATSLMSLSATSLMGIVSAMIMFLGARQILAGTMTPGTFFSYTLFLGFLIAPVFQIVAIGPQITEALAGLERTREVLNENPEDEDPNRRESLERIRGEVAFEDVSFSYDTGKEVLHEIAFNSQPGTVTALVGPSGAGKSTVIGLIAAFYVPTSGRVLVDGVDLAKVRLDSYRTQLGVVLQETFLFDGSIRENVGFSRPNATEEEILAACRIARVDEFAEGFDEQVRHGSGRTRRKAFRRAAAARVHRARDSGRSAHSDFGRSDLEPGFRIGGVHSGRIALLDARAHYVRDRASPIHGAARRPDSGARSRPDYRARHARHRCTPRAGGISISTRSSTAWNRTCFSRPVKAATEQWTRRMRMVLRQDAAREAGHQRKLRHCQKQYA